MFISEGQPADDASEGHGEGRGSALQGDVLADCPHWGQVHRLWGAHASQVIFFYYPFISSYDQWATVKTSFQILAKILLFLMHRKIKLRSVSIQKAVFRIHEILGWIRIRIRGSMPLTSGSGSGSGYFRPWSSRCQQKLIFNTIFSAYYFLKVLHLHHFSKIKSQKEPQNSRNLGFSYYFCMMIEGSRSRAGSGSIPLTSGSGSGSGRPKNLWIRWIRIRNTTRRGIRSFFFCHLMRDGHQQIL